MSIAKDRMTALIQAQPEEASFDDILRELAFERMIERGLQDSKAGRVISDEEMGKIIDSWEE